MGLHAHSHLFNPSNEFVRRSFRRGLLVEAATVFLEHPQMPRKNIKRDQFVVETNLDGSAAATHGQIYVGTAAR